MGVTRAVFNGSIQPFPALGFGLVSFGLDQVTPSYAHNTTPSLEAMIIAEEVMSNTSQIFAVKIVDLHQASRIKWNHVSDYLMRPSSKTEGSKQE